MGDATHPLRRRSVAYVAQAVVLGRGSPPAHHRRCGMAGNLLAHAARDRTVTIVVRGGKVSVDIGPVCTEAATVSETGEAAQ